MSIYLFLRLYKIDDHLNFSDEQGKFLLAAYDIWTNKKLTLLGPTTSINYAGRYFFQGPAMYYILIPVQILGHWQPITASYLLIGLNLTAMLLIYLSVRKMSGSAAGFIAALLVAIFPDLVYYSQFVWNPNFLPFFSAVILALVTGLFKVQRFWQILLTGFVSGLCLQFHYQVILIIICLVIYLRRYRQMNMAEGLIFLGGIIFGYLPMVIFELRHNFYNSRTIWLLLSNGAFFGKGEIPSYYFLSLYPFALAVGGILISKLIKKSKFWLIFLATIIILCLTGDIIQFRNYRGLPDKWKLPIAKQASQIIESQHPTNFNLVNLVSGDTRAYQLRYLITITGLNTKGVEKYPDAATLFVVSSETKNKVLANPVWEIQSFGPVISIREWKLDNGFYLYRLDKFTKI